MRGGVEGFRLSAWALRSISSFARPLTTPSVFPRGDRGPPSLDGRSGLDGNQEPLVPLGRM